MLSTARDMPGSLVELVSRRKRSAEALGAVNEKHAKLLRGPPMTEEDRRATVTDLDRLYTDGIESVHAERTVVLRCLRHLEMRSVGASSAVPLAESTEPTTSHEEESVAGGEAETEEGSAIGDEISACSTSGLSVEEEGPSEYTDRSDLESNLKEEDEVEDEADEEEDEEDPEEEELEVGPDDDDGTGSEAAY